MAVARFVVGAGVAGGKPSLEMGHRTMMLTGRPGSAREKREAVIRGWQRGLMHEVVPALIRKWQARLGVVG